MPLNSEGVFTTGSGVVIKQSDLTHQFTFFGKSFPIGKFDPVEYPVMLPADTSWQKLGIEVLLQLEDSQAWSIDEMVTIASMQSYDFLMCINLIPRS